MVYKVLVDLDTVDLNVLRELTDNKGLELCVAEDSVFFYDKNNRKVQISNIMKKLNTSGFVIKPVETKPKPGSDFASTWCFDKMNQEELERFEAEHQAELRTMMDNIEAVSQAVKNLKKEETVDGTGSSQEQGGSSSETTH